ALGGADDHAGAGRHGLPLRRAPRRRGIHDPAGLPRQSQSGVLAVLARPAAGADRALRARRPDGRARRAPRSPAKKKRMSAVLRTESLSKSFGAFKANSDVSLTFEAGARHALIGPNGAGKTTFINLLTGVLAPSGGEVLFKGSDITKVEQAERVKLGIARTFQINRLFRGLSVLENVYMSIAERVGAAPDMLRPAGKRGDVIDEAMELLTRLKLADIAHKTIPELPYGRQRLVELAITLG